MDTQILLFKINNQQYGIPIGLIDRIIWAVEITPLPNAPQEVMGVINVHGTIVTVVNIRKLLELPSKKIELSSRLILLKINSQLFAIIVDDVLEMKTCIDSDKIFGATLFPHLKTLDYVLKEKEEIIFIYSWEKLIPHFDIQHAASS